MELYTAQLLFLLYRFPVQQSHTKDGRYIATFNDNKDLNVRAQFLKGEIFEVDEKMIHSHDQLQSLKLQILRVRVDVSYQQSSQR